MNVAARLESLAEPGGVCISGDAYRQIRNRLEVSVTDLGEQHLKNIAEPVRVYKLRLMEERRITFAEVKAGSLPDRPPIAVLPLSCCRFQGHPVKLAWPASQSPQG